MAKDFDSWNTIKKATDGLDDSGRPFFHEGDVWWIRLGKNIGYELDGKSSEFTRPVIVIKKYNRYSFLALPLTQSFATLSQLRNIDSKRLVKKIARVAQRALEIRKKEASRVNFG